MSQDSQHQKEVNELLDDIEATLNKKTGIKVHLQAMLSHGGKKLKDSRLIGVALAESGLSHKNIFDLSAEVESITSSFKLPPPPPHPKSQIKYPALIKNPFDPSGALARKRLCCIATLNARAWLLNGEKMKALPKAEGDKSSADKVDMNLVTDYYRRWLSLTDDPLPTGTLWLQRKSRGYAVWEREREQAEMSGTRFDTPKPCDEKTDFEYVSTLDYTPADMHGRFHLDCVNEAQFGLERGKVLLALFTPPKQGTGKDE